MRVSLVRQLVRQSLDQHVYNIRRNPDLKICLHLRGPFLDSALLSLFDVGSGNLNAFGPSASVQVV